MLSFLAPSLSFRANEASREISNHHICIFSRQMCIIIIKYVYLRMDYLDQIQDIYEFSNGELSAGLGDFGDGKYAS